MKTNFELAMDFIMRDDIEGGYVNHPNDPGGETKYGISKRTFPQEDIKNLTKERAYELYKQHFWDAYSLGKLETLLGIVAMDSYVQHSPVAVKRMLDASGNNWEKLIIARRAFYTRLVSINPKLTVFARGWNNRMNKLDAYCRKVSLAPAPPDCPG